MEINDIKRRLKNFEMHFAVMSVGTLLLAFALFKLIVRVRAMDMLLFTLKLQDL